MTSGQTRSSTIENLKLSSGQLKEAALEVHRGERIEEETEMKEDRREIRSDSNHRRADDAHRTAIFSAQLPSRGVKGKGKGIRDLYKGVNCGMSKTRLQRCYSL